MFIHPFLANVTRTDFVNLPLRNFSTGWRNFRAKTYIPPPKNKSKRVLWSLYDKISYLFSISQSSLNHAHVTIFFETASFKEGCRAGGRRMDYYVLDYPEKIPSNAIRNTAAVEASPPPIHLGQGFMK